MTKFLLKILLLCLLVILTYFYFGEYGPISIKTTNVEISTTLSFIAAAIFIWVIIIVYMASILRFIIELPSRIISYFSEIRERKARNLLLDIMFLKEARRPYKAFDLFKKHRSKLEKHDQRLFMLLNYTFNKSHFNEVELLDQFIDLSRNPVNGEIIWQEFILPNYHSGKLAEIERFTTELRIRNINSPIFDLVKLYIHMHENNFDLAKKMHKKITSAEVLSEKSLALVETEILCAKAFHLIESGKMRDAAKVLFEAFSISLDAQIVRNLRKLPSKEIDGEKYNKLIESKWAVSPNNALINCYLEINGDSSQGKMLNLIEKLLEINSSKAALISAATEYYILGYEKQAVKLLQDVNPEEYTSSLNKAIIFRNALSTEAKSDKLSIFRELIFDRYDY